ncbi:unnamed protein product [Brachionus calyciflorus]|uniref:Uncharacterized protein n=1 Tax=Brachionus calyciflorus TaxID=104777 RepID=A0A813XB62_9BILA|nr:unnamed protein product [Brachionus calyciflorus]
MACGYGLSSFAASWVTPALAVPTLATQFGVFSQCGGRSSAPTFAAVPLVALFGSPCSARMAAPAFAAVPLTSWTTQVPASPCAARLAAPAFAAAPLVASFAVPVMASPCASRCRSRRCY